MEQDSIETLHQNRQTLVFIVIIIIIIIILLSFITPQGSTSNKHWNEMNEMKNI